MTEPTTIYNRPGELLQNLIRFDTTNPPGNEVACINYIQELCHSLDIETTIVGREDNRPNLIARIKGNGDAAPFMMYGHVDVVSTANQDWEHPPFSGDLIDGWIWGRGALDMKGGVAMMTAAFLKAKAENLDLPGDVILCIVSDEEAGGDYGARYLVENHADLFEGVKYAIGEFGGFPMIFGGKKFFAIQTAEKKVCWTKAIFRGPAGHGSMPHRNTETATYKLGKALQALNTKRLPVHISPPAEKMINAIADGLEGQMGDMLRLLLNPDHTDTILDEMGDIGRRLDAVLHNTASPNMVRGGDKVNVIPGQVELDIDIRLVPNSSPDEVFQELRDILGVDVELEVIRTDVGGDHFDMGLYDTLAEIILEGQEDAQVFPLLLSGGTDGRHFERLNIQSYGFLPMDLPEDYNFMTTVHAANERIPAEALDFGTDKIVKVLQRFH